MNVASESRGVYTHLRARVTQCKQEEVILLRRYMQSFSRAREAWEWRDLLQFQSLESVLERYHLLERLSFFFYTLSLSLECEKIFSTRRTIK